MSDKKILLVNNGYPSERYPNYTAYIRDMELALSRAGYRVEHLVIKYEKKISPLYKLRKYLRFWLSCLTKRGNFDFIYINHLPHVWPIMLNPFLRRRKFIIHWQGDDLAGKSTLSAITLPLAGRFINQAVNMVPSRYFSTILNKKYPGTEVHVSPSGGVDTELFSTDRKPRKDFTIGFASALIREKGAETLIYLIGRQKEIEAATGRKIAFNIINYGSKAEHYLKRIQQSAPDSCKVFNRMSKNRMPEFYQSIDLLLFPSQRESLGLVALEAMSCGVPVVAPDICAFPEYIEPGVTGELVEPQADETQQNRAFLAAVIKAVNSIESYTPRRIVEENYSSASVTAGYQKLLDSL